MNGPIRSYRFKSPLSRTNEPGTCLWCGRKLPKSTNTFEPERRGRFGDNAFCGIQCGYEFGLTFAISGARLKPFDADAEAM